MITGWSRGDRGLPGSCCSRLAGRNMGAWVLVRTGTLCARPGCALWSPSPCTDRSGECEWTAFLWIPSYPPPTFSKDQCREINWDVSKDKQKQNRKVESGTLGKTANPRLKKCRNSVFQNFSLIYVRASGLGSWLLNVLQTGFFSCRCFTTGLCVWSTWSNTDVLVIWPAW